MVHRFHVAGEAIFIEAGMEEAAERRLFVGFKFAHAPTPNVRVDELAQPIHQKAAFVIDITGRCDDLAQQPDHFPHVRVSDCGA